MEIFKWILIITSLITLHFWVVTTRSYLYLCVALVLGFLNSFRFENTESHWDRITIFLGLVFLTNRPYILYALDVILMKITKRLSTGRSLSVTARATGLLFSVALLISVYLMTFIPIFPLEREPFLSK